MTTLRRPPLVVTLGRAAVPAAVAVGALFAVAIGRAVAGSTLHLAARSLWLTVHLLSVVPALPLGAWVLWGPKGGARHRLAGRMWGGLMMITAASSFGLHGLRGGLSPIHLLSALTLVMIPRGVMQARRGAWSAHRRTMTLTYAGLLGAGVFAMVPGRLVGFWLFG